MTRPSGRLRSRRHAVDSARDLADAGNALIAGYGAPPLPQAQIVGMVGDGARELVRRLLEACALDVPLDDALARFLEATTTV